MNKRNTGIDKAVKDANTWIGQHTDVNGNPAVERWHVPSNGGLTLKDIAGFDTSAE
jgi:hypothetical protein